MRFPVNICFPFLLLFLGIQPLEAQDPEIMEVVEGLWSYETLQIGESPPVPLTGLFLFQNGRFLQQTINEGGIFVEQLGMGHSGTYEWRQGIIRLLAKVGLMIEPTKTPILESRSNSLHHITPDLSGDRLTLSFDMGVIQKLTRVTKGDQFEKIIDLDEGGLGLVGDRFILVAEHPGEGVAGSGHFTRSENELRFKVDRWFTLRESQAQYQRDGVIVAIFDGQKLSLPKGMTFRVKP
jgi:hypothetical protein